MSLFRRVAHGRGGRLGSDKELSKQRDKRGVEYISVAVDDVLVHGVHQERIVEIAVSASDSLSLELELTVPEHIFQFVLVAAGTVFESQPFARVVAKGRTLIFGLADPTLAGDSMGYKGPVVPDGLELALPEHRPFDPVRRNDEEIEQLTHGKGRMRRQVRLRGNDH